MTPFSSNGSHVVDGVLGIADETVHARGVRDEEGRCRNVYERLVQSPAEVMG